MLNVKLTKNLSVPYATVNSCTKSCFGKFQKSTPILAKNLNIFLKL